MAGDFLPIELIKPVNGSHPIRSLLFECKPQCRIMLKKYYYLNVRNSKEMQFEPNYPALVKIITGLLLQILDVRILK